MNREAAFLAWAPDASPWSVRFPTDFPSANLLLARGVRRAVLARAGDAPAQADLAHTLRRWREAGIELLALDPAVGGVPRPLAVPRPWMFRATLYNLLAR